MLDDNPDAVTAGGARREEPLVRDWVVCQGDEEEERTSHASALKGSGFHCASLWIPFSPFIYGGTKQKETSFSYQNKCCVRMSRSLTT